MPAVPDEALDVYCMRLVTEGCALVSDDRLRLPQCKRAEVVAPLAFAVFTRPHASVAASPLTLLFRPPPSRSSLAKVCNRLGLREHLRVILTI